MPRLLQTPLTILLSGLAAVAVLAAAGRAGLTPDAAPQHLAALLVFLTGLGFAAFLWWLASRCFALLRDPATTPEQVAALRDLPLGLPEGTVRALLALIVGVVGLPLLLFSNALALDAAIAGYVNGIVAGVFGYYFGARSTTGDAQAARRAGEALEAERRANDDLRARADAAREEAEKPARLAEAAARLERHVAVARVVAERVAPLLPAAAIPADALREAERALATAREEGPLAAAADALAGPAGPLAALLRAAAPALPMAAAGPLAGAAMALAIGWRLSSGAWRRWRASVLDAPHDPTLFDPGAITPASAELRLAASPVFARAFAGRLAEPGFVAALLDLCLRDDAAERLWAEHGALFASPAEAAEGLAEFRRALLAERVAADLSPALLEEAARALSDAPAALRPPAAAPLPAPAPSPEAEAALHALALLAGELRERKLDPVAALRDLRP